MNDGTDWNSHIGMFLGNHQRRHSPVDFIMEDSQIEHATQDGLYDVRPTLDQGNVYGGPVGSQSQSVYMAPSSDDSITLQDVINSTEDDFMLPEQDEPWHVLDARAVSNSEVIIPSYHFEPSQHSAATVILDKPYIARQSSRDFSESLESAEGTDPCYARLLWRCLRDAPDHTLSLKEIYAWIKQHTQKARDPKNKGWQNSVRHNLSMNAAFEKVNVAVGNDSKIRSLWRLTESAIQTGVISTTRYRRDPKRKHERRGQPALKRQQSGARGGAATRASLQYKRLREARERCHFMPQAMQQHYSISMPEHSAATAMAAFAGHTSIQRSPIPYFHAPAIAQHSVTSSPYAQPVEQIVHEPTGSGCQQSFELSHLDPNNSMFGNMDIECSGSPSSYTDSSLFTEDMPYCQPSTNVGGQF